jgi:hypothetical protein
MKEVAILLLFALLLNGCGTTTNTQTAAGGTWQSVMSAGEVTGLTFTTQFTVDSNGDLSISYFQFLNQGACFPINGGSVSGSMILTENQTDYSVTGPFTYTVQSGGSTLSLTGNVTGTENGLNGGTLSSGTVTGTWTLTGGTGCDDAVGGIFTMTQATS